MTLFGNVSPERVALLLAVLVLTVVIANVLAAYLRKYLKVREKEAGWFALLPRAVMYVTYLGGLYYGLYGVIELDLKAFAAAFGILGLVVAFSAQQTLQNVIAGIIMFLDQPLTEGDYIEYAGGVCKVVDVSVRRTRLRALDGRSIIVPNALFVTGNVVNYSRNSFHRISVTIPVRGDADVEKAKSIIYAIAVQHPEIVPQLQPRRKSLIQTMLDTPLNIQKMEPKIWVKEISKEKTVLEAWFWVVHVHVKERIMSAVLQEVKKEFDKAGIMLG